MRTALSRAPLEAMMQLALALTIVVIALDFSAVPWLTRIGTHARWPALLVFFLLALLLAFARGVDLRPGRSVYALAAALAALSLLSTAWSVAPRLTLERSLTLAVALATGITLAGVAARRRELLVSLLVTIVAAAAGVCVGGAILYAFDPGAAVQAASRGTPLRFRGLGGNPNTISMLAALAAPLAAWLLTTATRRLRLLGGIALVATLGQTAASGSRSALVAALAGLASLALAAPDLRRRAVALAAVVAVAGCSVGVHALLDRTQEPVPQAAVQARAEADRVDAAGVPTSSLGGDQYPALEDELGSRLVPLRRSLFGGGGRAQAWEAALRQARERPVLGYGAGTEDRVFIDRIYDFQGSRAESSYAGLFLQLGALGLALWLAVAAALLTLVVRGLRRPGTPRGLVVACTAVAVAGYVLAVGQSYVYSVGNVATLTLWIGVFLVPAAVGSPATTALVAPVAHLRRERTKAMAGP